MNPTGGYPRSFLQPLDADGNCPSDDPDGIDSVGCHQGPHAGLNVYNPQPGFEYLWVHRNPMRRTVVRSWGGQPVTGSDPEMSAFARENGTHGVDSSQLYNDVELWRIPVEKMRERREAHAQAARAQFRSTEAEYASQSRSNIGEDHYAQQHGASLRFAGRKHHTSYEGPDGTTVEVWTPDAGIIAREDVNSD